MDGSSASNIAIPIVVTLALAAWLILGPCDATRYIPLCLNFILRHFGRRP